MAVRLLAGTLVLRPLCDWGCDGVSSLDRAILRGPVHHRRQHLLRLGGRAVLRSVVAPVVRSALGEGPLLLADGTPVSVQGGLPNSRTGRPSWGGWGGAGTGQQVLSII
jgi:hypothetical protein